MLDRLLRQLYYRWRAQRHSYRPPLALKHLQACVARPGANPGLLAGDPSQRKWEQARVVALRFRDESRGSRFFASPNSLRVLAQMLAHERPDWVARTLARVRGDLEIGLDVYCRRVPPLDSSFPWGEVELGMGGDRIYPFRPQRFAFFPQMALALHYDATLSDRLSSILQSWVDFAQADRGAVAYPTKLVVTQRFLSLSWGWAFLSARQAENLDPRDWELESLVLRIMYSDAGYLMKGIGGEFPNNHLLADWFIGWYIETLFPELLPAAKGQGGIEDGWLAELRRQTYSDGSSFEHSVHYHEFVTELVTAYVLLQQRNEREVPQWVKALAHRMLRFQVDIHGNQRQALAIGDTTEDPMFPLDVARVWSLGGNRELLRGMYEPQLAPAPVDDPSVERAYWLLAGRLAQAPEGPACEPGLRSYDEGGFFIIKDGGEELVFRTGPAPGVPLCAGHMHADLLSIFLRVDKCPVLVEAGTCTYLLNTPESMPPWRRYFLGPAAHNGLSIESVDPLETITDSYRSRELTCRVKLMHREDRASLCWLEARIMSDNLYDGYTRGVVRVRGHYWLMYDCFPQAIESHSAWTGFQLDEAAEVRLGDSVGVRIDSSDRWLQIWNAPSDIEVLTGSLDPLGGWLSKSYGVVKPAPQLRYPVNSGHGVWVFSIDSSNPPRRLVVAEESNARRLAFRFEAEGYTDYLFVGPEPDAPEAACIAWGITFDGGLLWLRESASGSTQARMLGIRRLHCERLGIDLQTQEGTTRSIAIDAAREPREVFGRHAEWVRCTWRGDDLNEAIQA